MHRRIENGMTDKDEEYIKIVLDAIRVCAFYIPKFGQRSRSGLTLEQFQELYQKDLFYNWFGLDNPMMYAAHKAAGGMTSVYRQIGIGCEKLFRKIIQDSFQLSEEDATWSYQLNFLDGRKRTLSLDARIPVAKISDAAKRNRFREWINQSANILDVDESVFKNLSGAVFEIRQGYKSKDSKRQNADIANAAVAYTKGYFPCAVILSTQIDDDVFQRYRTEKWSIMTGITGAENPLISTYDFMRDIVGYDLAAYFERNSSALRMETDVILNSLLSPEGT